MGSVINVLLSPRQTFERIRENGGAFAIPFILLVAVTLVTVFMQLPAIEASFDEVKLEGNMDRETVRQAGVMLAFIMAPITIAVIVFVKGLLLMLVNMVIRGEAKYMQLVKVSVLSSMPGLVNAILLGIMARTMDASTVNDINLSLGAFVEDKSGVLYSIANLVNPFGLWGLAITVIGTMVMTRKSGNNVAMWVIGGWLVINGVFSAIGSSLT